MSLEEEYTRVFGFKSMMSLGANWLGQVKQSITPEDSQVLVRRAESLHEQASRMALRMGPLMDWVLKHCIEYLDEADDLESRIVRAIYIFSEAERILKSGGVCAYADAAWDRDLFWNRDYSDINSDNNSDAEDESSNV